MKRRVLISLYIIVVFTSIVTILPDAVWAAPMHSQQADKVVRGWLKANARPLGTALGQQIKNIKTFSDADGQPIYYVVYLSPSGFVIVPADNLVEPIIAFVTGGTFDPSLDNPLGALVSQDLPQRITTARGLQAASSGGRVLSEREAAFQKAGVKSQNKWTELQDYAGTGEIKGAFENGGLNGEPAGQSATYVSDVRVAPLLQSKWSQGLECGEYCYNYYTPNNYVCGCVATAMVQLMRFHQYPTAAIGVHTFDITVDGTPQTADTRGGDGSGGPYNWDNMVLDPECSNYSDERWRAIGALCYDAGVTVNMQYSSTGSGAWTGDTKDALIDIFGYSNGVFGYNGDNDIGAGLMGMLNPNLDASYPTLLGIHAEGESGGHAIVCDGYGYDGSTLYNHLNMGWAGYADAWYNLPYVIGYNVVHSCIYNVFVTGSGEIISGRVTENDNPISGAVVTAQGPGGSYTDITNSQGIYSLTHVQSLSIYTVSVTYGSTHFTDQQVTTGISNDWSNVSGNLWGIDFEQDFTPPTPDTAEWEIEPQATGLHTIAMEVKAATDASGVEYFFECVTDANFNSDWQDSVLYERADYAEGTTYTFKVKYRDKSESQNEGNWSSEESATTASGSDNKSPFPNTSRWKIKPKVLRLQPTPRVRMSARSSTDENGPVEYSFTCTHVDPPGPLAPDSGWITSEPPVYTITSGLTLGSTYTFTVKAKDALDNETTESIQASVTVSGVGSSVLTVPVPYATIQDAVDAASDDDIVEVRPGTYRGDGNRDIDFKNKAITVRSIDPCDPAVIAGTIIEVQDPYDWLEQFTNFLLGNRIYVIDPHRAFIFQSGEKPNSILAGFTITYGFFFSEDASTPPDVNGVGLGGGGIGCFYGSNPTIRNCVITNCFVGGQDGGDGAVGDPTVMPQIPGGNGGNGGWGVGGGIYCDFTSEPDIYNCTISNCFAMGGFGGNGGHGEDVTDPNDAGGIGGNGGGGGNGVGGGICINSGSAATVSNCTISNCFAFMREGGAEGMGGTDGMSGADGNGFGGGIYYGYSYSNSTTDTEVIESEADNAGGGIYCEPYSLLTLINCDISDNDCVGGGGGIWFGFGGELTLNDCSVSGNSAFDISNGGGIYAGDVNELSSTSVIIDSNSIISGNSAGYNGGGLFLAKTNLTVNDSTISYNNAFEGAGIWVYNGTANITNCMVLGNSATQLGGGFAFINSPTIIDNSIITSNSATSTVGATGGALFFEGWSDSPHQITNCLITDNTAYSYGGGLSNNIGSWVRVTNCTFSGNEAIGINGVGGGISCAEFWAYTEIINSIMWDNEATIGGSQIAVGDPYGSTPQGDGPYADVDVSYSDVQGGEESVWLEDETQEFTALWWLDGSIDEDPLFAPIKATEQTYFLSQVASGQLEPNSPCVDTGDGVAIPGTTRTDYVADSGTVDMGYHYEAGLAISQYQLTIEVIDQGYGTFGTVLPPWEPGTYTVDQGSVIPLHAEPNDGWEVYRWTGADYVPMNPADPNYNTVTMDSDRTVTVEFGPSDTYKLVIHAIGNGTVEPAGLTVWSPGTIVPLVATPDNPSLSVEWTGSDDDITASLTNTVTMNAHKEVFVEFYVPRILRVSSSGPYTNIQSAIDDANDNDIVEIVPGTYFYEPEQHPVGDILTIDGKAITITSVNPDDPCVVAATIIDGRFVIQDVQRDTIINGLTIRNSVEIAWFSREPEPDPGNDGLNGISFEGGGMELWFDASPDVRNCRFEGCYIWGGTASNGNSGIDDSGSPGNGGWAGWARGGAVSVGENGSPIFTNCAFIDCWARGGDGGNGADDPVWGGHGGNWEEHGWDGTSWIWDYVRANGPFLNYWKYSGYGGAIYCYPYSAPEFVDCNFINNQTYGGSCGITGELYYATWPRKHYKIDSFGGAVYAAEGSHPVFTGCVFIGNESDVNGPSEHGRDDEIPVNYDPYISYGGAAAFEDSALITFNNCTFDDSLATVGGGIWGAGSGSYINDCNFVRNTAFHGGGVYFVRGTPEIVRGDFSENEALYDTSAVRPSDSNVVLLYGEGGAINIIASDAVVVGCNLANNNAGGSGGGIYISDGSKPLVKNCLVRGNFANRDGGGVSANWHSDVNIVNCTIADNFVTIGGTDTGFGGGLYCSYSSYIDIINSIIWGNYGTDGAQLAIFTGYGSDQRHSTAGVKYSVIGPPEDIDVITIEPAEALAINVTNDADVLVNSILGPGIELIGTPQYTGVSSAAGTFAGGLAAGIGIESGIILTSGNANLALPPNAGDETTADNNYPGDSDLSALLQARDVNDAVDANTFDATILEFTFRTEGGNIFFNFVFASEEYNEFVNLPSNDAFGFFLDGENIALIPGTTVPVAINSVNGGNPLGTNASNSHLFNNNDPSDGGPFFDIEYDGFTSVFTAQAFNVGTGTHTIKLAIADTANGAYDSAVFIEGGSFSDKSLYCDPVYVDDGCTLKGWDPNAPDPNNPWDANTYNLRIDDDPLFVNGYYLSQIAAGQPVDSLCLNSGSTDANAPGIGLDTYTTRTDSVPDDGIVDRGYHYEPFEVPQYQLSFTAIGADEPNWPVPVIIEPIPVEPNFYEGTHNWYETVNLRIDPNDPNYSTYYQVLWAGTDDDSLSGPNNTIIMDSNEVVTVQFVKAKYDLEIRVDGGNGQLSAEWINENGDPCEIEAPSANKPIKFGTVVQLTAKPDVGYRVKRWIGTDDDTSRDPDNTVTIDSDRTVSVKFETPTILSVPGDYSSIQQALDAAGEGDTVLVAPGTYTTSTGYEIVGRNITISGVAPNDPCVVAATVINLEIGEEGYINTSAFRIYDVGPEMVLDGITIRGFSHRAYSGIDAREAGEDGFNGAHAFGGGIICYMASPTIKNCIIADCNVIGGSGGDGYDGSGNEQNDPNIHGTDGGWPGRAYGGGLACLEDSSPTVINCTFDNCVAIGGNGGNGGNGTTSQDIIAYGGRGGGWYYGRDSIWYNVPWDRSSQGYYREGPATNSFYDFYTEYTGRGGAVFVGEYCSPVFTRCTFTNNRTEGGTCGICGLDGWLPNHRIEPSLNWEIESFGGAVFCEANSAPTFAECTFTGNTADVNYLYYNDDPYVGYGGAVAWETNANVVFEGCTFNGNLASIGGAMYGEWAYHSIVDCNFTANRAYHGGGLFFIGGASEIIQSKFSENEALYDTSITDVNVPVEVLGEGGAIHCFDADVNIIDCNIFDNDAAGSGGGIYITGNSIPLVKNCLITDNIAGRDGGGISVNWSSDSNIVNCTIVGNRVTGSGFDIGYGGGLYCSQGGHVNIVSSILWDNLGSVGAQGSQLAIASGTNTQLNVTYSDIQSATDPNAFGQKMDALDLVFCIDTTGSMGDDIAAVKTAARQITDAIADEIPDFRIAVVDYKDFNQPSSEPNAGSYGDNSDYPYRTDLEFTTDTNQVIDALNELTASGGADWPESVYTAVMHCIDHNSLMGALEGELYGADANSMGPGAWRSGDVMRVVILMGDAPPHDPEPFTGYTLDDIVEAAGGAEPKRIVSVLIGQDPEAGSYFRSLAGETGGTVLEAAGAEEVVGALLDAIEMISQIPNPVFYDSNCVFNWDLNNYIWDLGSNNIDEDPCFIAGYYLSQFAAGQPVESNCVDGGKELASDIGLDTYTTRTDSVPDGGIVDMGYHYRTFTVPQYKLTFEAIDTGEPGWPVPEIIEPVTAEPNFYEGMSNWYKTVQLRIDGSSYDPNIYQVLWTGTDDDSISGPNNTVTMNGDKVVTVQFVKTKYMLTIWVYGGNGRLFAEWSEDDTLYNFEAPIAYPVKFGTVVQLTAEPSGGYRVKRWSGTDDDSSRSANNTVTMNSDKVVRVEFGLPVIVNVPQDYPTIQDAVFAAEEGDTIMVYPGTYYGGYNAVMVVVDKSVTIKSEHPDDPCCVAATIIDGYRGINDYHNLGIVLAANAVLDGLTIQNCGGYVGDSDDGSRSDPCHPDGLDGGCAEGPAIYIVAGTSPVIKNCVIRDNLIIGGDGGNGASADEENNAGRGGWAGWARGGAVYCGVNSSPRFINCKILDNEARGGNAGNGGDYAEDGGIANYGGNWSLLGSPASPVFYIDSSSLGVTPITNSNLWEVLQWDWAGSYWFMYGQPTEISYIGNYRWYSGYGGGVYCDENSMVDFEDCTISGNIALGGMSGQGGVRGESGRQQEPLVPYEIPSYGGGVYCAADASVTFSGCVITDNVSSPSAYIDPNDPDSGPRHRLDPYLGHGGGVCAEKTASVAFIDCTFNENEASLGGGIFWDDANAELVDSNIVDNVAYKGGGVYFNGGLAEIVQSDFRRNDANYVNDFNDVNELAGEGGGIYCSDANVMIVDCNLLHNEANSSGGGAYVSNSVAWFKNCLVTSNSAGRDGGGISVNWYTESLITNCTFASNAAPGTFGEPGNTGFGGGLYCGYESNCEVTDSIFWNNLAIRGVEIAVYTGFKYEVNPSIFTISYSDVKGGQAGVGVDTGCTLNWLTGNIAVDPLFVTGLLGDYYLSQTGSGQSQNSPCVDTGSDLANNVDMVVNLIDTTGYTTRTDSELDSGIVDMGYHYPSAFEICGFCNLFDEDPNGDPEGFIDFRDFAMFAMHWLDVGCSGGNQWCEGADFTTDTVVNTSDLLAFVNCWLAEDTSAPVPNPSEWEDPPHRASPTIVMEAKEAVDGWGWNVEYYFERVPLGDPCSGWQDSPIWVDTDVIKGTRYGYRVRTRDELGNVGEWSEIGYAGEDDVTPPAPEPYIDYNEPNITSIMMTSRIAGDDSGDEYVEYYFDTNTPGAHDSDWLSFALGETPTYTDVNLLPDTEYAYRVKARDRYNNETSWSDWVYITTLEAPEQNKPTPDPAEWAEGGEPILINHGDGYWFEMTAATAMDDSGEVWYQFVCDTKDFGEYSSDWQQNTYYEIRLGWNKFPTEWYVIVRDRYNNMTDPSTPLELAWPAID